MVESMDATRLLLHPQLLLLCFALLPTTYMHLYSLVIDLLQKVRAPTLRTLLPGKFAGLGTAQRCSPPQAKGTALESRNDAQKDDFFRRWFSCRLELEMCEHSPTILVCLRLCGSGQAYLPPVHPALLDAGGAKAGPHLAG